MTHRSFHVSLVAGARPNFMKVAPIVHALNARREVARAAGLSLRVSIVHTGQFTQNRDADGNHRTPSEPGQT